MKSPSSRAIPAATTLAIILYSIASATLFSSPNITSENKLPNDATVGQNASVVTKPEILGKRDQPIYPISMLISGIKAELVVQFTVTEKGSVQDVVILRTNAEDFNQPVIDALLRWKFKPATRDGKPIAMDLVIPIHFDTSTDDIPGRDFYKVQTTAKAQQNLPEDMRFDVAPRVTNVVTPVYPYTLLAEKIKGSASVGVRLNEKGQVVEAVVTEATRPEFGESALAAVCKYEFQPATYKSKPTGTIFKIDLDFDRSGKTVSDDALAILSIETKKPERIVPAKKLDALPKPTYHTPPVFPAQLRKTIPTGNAVVEFIIDTKGAVQLPRVVSASEPAFGYAAVQAISVWRFTPPLAASKPVITRIRLPFKFSLDDVPSQSAQ